MASRFDSSSDILSGLKDDILWLLILIYSFKVRARLEGLGQWSREHMSIEFMLLDSAVRDIVMRLTALDDDLKNNRSFQTLLKALNRENLLEQKRSKALNEKVKKYRDAVNKLKVEHRNQYISHVNTDASVLPRVIDRPVRFYEAASLAVNLMDDLAGRTLQYHFKMGSNESIDLRDALQAE
ncbi:hypothetical protein [Roseovarius sp. ZX-A-9]|uniref:hypothetical protein n=1 Tax=Roseovarius sp. ZX-A-9 TaxID=3014783 RepID=UPI00232F56E4|nr:hypothetical protein [Roseovarius sp. ZX-A-9]